MALFRRCFSGNGKTEIKKSVEINDFGENFGSIDLLAILHVARLRYKIDFPLNCCKVNDTSF
jgi:hypothetical protein